MADVGQYGDPCSCLRRRRKKDEGDQALGRSRGGFSSKVHAACDALGNPLRFSLTRGQAGDAPEALGLIDGIKTKAVLADGAYDSDAILEAIRAREAEAVIPPHPVRSIQRKTDWALYKERHKIEVMFGHMKHYRRVFARFDKLARRYLAFVHFAAACILLK
jgi:transposase